MAAPVINAPAEQEIVTVGVAYNMSIYAPGDASVNVYLNNTLLGVATYVGIGVWSYSWTPAAVATTGVLKATGNTTGDSVVRNVTIAEANAVTTALSGWSQSGGLTITGGYPDPDGGNNAYLVKINAAVSAASRYLYKTASTSPTEYQNGMEMWVKPYGTGMSVLSVAHGGGNCFYDLLSGQSTAGMMSAAVVETSTNGGGGWNRLQASRSTGPSAQSTFYWYLCRSLSTNAITVTSGEVISGIGFYMYDPRWVGTVKLPLTAAQRMAIYFNDLTSGIETWYYKHDFLDTSANMAGGPGGLTLKVIKPTGWDATKRYKILYVLPALLASTEGSLGHATPEAAMIAGDYANIYNCVIVIPYDRAGFLWWGCNSSGAANAHDWVAYVLTDFCKRLLGGSLDRNDHIILGYSKSAHAAFSLLMRHPDKFGFAGGWDSPLANGWPNNNSPDSYTTQANWNLYDPIQLISSNVSSLTDRRRLVVMGYEVFPTETALYKAELDANNVSYYDRQVDEGVHSWGTSTWVPIAVEQLMNLTRSASYPVYHSENSVLDYIR